MPEPDVTLITTAELAERLAFRHGPPWTLNRQNRISAINEEWWAGLIRAEEHVIHDPDAGLFAWDAMDGIYAPVSEHSMLATVSGRIQRVIRDCGMGDLASQRALGKLRNVVAFLRAISDRRDPFHHRSPLLGLQNGVVELTEAGRIRFHAPSPRFLLRHKSFVPYDPKATCPRFIAEFLGPMLDEEDLGLLQCQLGLMLVGLNPAHRMGILEGESAAGKTTLANLLISLIGEDRVCQLRTEHLENQFELDAFRGRSLLVGNDVGESFLNTPGAQTLKGLVSTDLYHPEAKGRRERLPLRGPFNVLIATNCKLTYRSQGDAGAWRRRLILYNCLSPQGRKRIPGFDQILLREEGPGIVNWMVEGLKNAWAQISSTGDLTLTPTQLDRVDKLIMRSDSVDTFCRRCVRSGEGELLSEDAVEAYATFCRDRGWVPLSERAFQEKFSRVMLEQFGRPQTHSMKNGGGRWRRGWTGVEIGPSNDGFRAVE